MVRVVFMGTPAFAVASLAALCRWPQGQVVGVFSQPDRPQGRGRRLAPTLVKAYALEQGLPVYQPQKIKAAESVALLRQLRPDLVVVTAFGQILSQEVLDVPPLGCVNVHASLLPKYRGAAPIQYALMAGEEESGVTIMLMDRGMDTGPILAQQALALTPDMTGGELAAALQELGARLLLPTLEGLLAGTVTPRPQEAAAATYATLLTREMEHLDWTKGAQELHNWIRAFNPEPGAFTLLPSGKKLKLFASRLAGSSQAPAGTVVAVTKKDIQVACGDGRCLALTLVQPEGKKPMAAAVFLNGHSLEVGQRLQ